MTKAEYISWKCVTIEQIKREHPKWNEEQVNKYCSELESLLEQGEKKENSMKNKQKQEDAMNLPVVRSVYEKELAVEASKRAKNIRTELNKVKKSFTNIAFNLHWLYFNETYKTLGFKNIYDFAKMEFGIARGTCNNFINVIERFAKRVDGKVVEEIDDCYKDFKSSQLILMLELSDSDIKKLDCGLSVRDMKKEIKKLVSDEQQEKSTEAESETESENEAIEVESVEINRQVLITINSIEDYDTQEDKIYEIIKRALKDKKHKVEIAYTW